MSRMVATGVYELAWTRPLEYTDSGLYECVSESPNGVSISTLDLTVQGGYINYICIDEVSFYVHNN